MYKKFLIAIVSILSLSTFDVSAQSANRRGFYIDLTAGANIGDICKRHKYDSYDGWISSSKVGGMELGVGAGYRLPFSSQFAGDFRVNFQDNFSYTKFFQIGILPGIRFTSKDFSGNKTFYMGLNTGLLIVPADETILYWPLELSLGFNLTPKVSLGIVGTVKMYGDGYYEDGSTRYVSASDTNAFLGLRFGYRF